MTSHVILVDKDGTQHVYTQDFIIISDEADCRIRCAFRCDGGLLLNASAKALALAFSFYKSTYAPTKWAWGRTRRRMKKLIMKLANAYLEEEQSHE